MRVNYRNCCRVGAWIVLALSLWLHPDLALAAEDGTPAKFVQDRFVIGLWVDPPMDERAPERYRELAQAGLNLVIAAEGGGDKAIAARQFALAESNGLKVLWSPGELPPSEYPDGAACWGYSLRDEPSVKDFPALAAKVKEVAAARPGKLAYINLFPSYASPWGQLGAPDYDTYVRLFTEQVPTAVLCMDHYPHFRPDGQGRDYDGRDAYCSDLAVMRKYALKQGVPFWNFFNAMPYGSQTNPTEAQMRWQISASIAYGAKGVLYFCYFTPSGGEFPKGGALVARDGVRTANWFKAQRLNAQLRNLGPTLMRLTSTGVWRVRPGDDAAAILKDAPIRNLSRAAGDPPGDYVVGAFRHEDGRRAVWLMNYQFAYSDWPTVTFDAPAEAVVEVDKLTGKEVPVRDESPDTPGLQLPLEDGEGRLFLLPGK